MEEEKKKQRWLCSQSESVVTALISGSVPRTSHSVPERRRETVSRAGLGRPVHTAVTCCQCELTKSRSSSSSSGGDNNSNGSSSNNKNS